MQQPTIYMYAKDTHTNTHTYPYTLIIIIYETREATRKPQTIFCSFAYTKKYK